MRNVQVRLVFVNCCLLVPVARHVIMEISELCAPIPTMPHAYFPSDRNRHRHTCRLAQQQSEPFPNANKNLVTARIKGENGELMLDHEGKKMRQPKGNVAAIVAAWAKNDSTAARQVELKVLDRMFRLET